VLLVDHHGVSSWSLLLHLHGLAALRRHIPLQLQRQQVWGLLPGLPRLLLLLWLLLLHLLHVPLVVVLELVLRCALERDLLLLGCRHLLLLLLGRDLHCSC
jgi:hypothetical protein